MAQTSGTWTEMILRLGRRLWWLAFFASVALIVASLPGYILVFLKGWQPPAVFGFLLEVVAVIGMTFSIAAACLCLALAMLVYRKLPKDPAGLLLSYFLLSYAVLIAGPGEQFLAYWLPQYNNAILILQGYAGPPVAVLLILVFPNGQFIPRWSRWLVPLSLVWGLAVYWLIPPEEIMRLSSLRALAGYSIILIFLLIAIGVQFYRYRRVFSRIERQQTKVVLVGGLIAFFLAILSSIPYFYMLNLPPGTPLPWWMPIGSTAWGAMLVILPLSLTIAILRYRLFDIDLVLRRTLMYSALTALLGMIYFGSVLVLQNLFQVITGHNEPSIATVISTLAIAALFTPLRRRLQDTIDRRFYRQHYDAQKTLESFAVRLREEVDLDELSDRLVAVVRETVQPESISLSLVKPKPPSGSYSS